MSKPRAYGIRNGNARLTDEQITAILEDPAPVREIAHRYGVSVSYVYYVLSGKRRNPNGRAPKTRTRVRIRPMSKQTDPSVLRDFAGLTAQINSLSEQRAQIAEKRRKVALKHHQNGVSIHDLAEAAGLSEAAVSKILKGGPSVRVRQASQSG